MTGFRLNGYTTTWICALGAAAALVCSPGQDGRAAAEHKNFAAKIAPAHPGIAGTILAGRQVFRFETFGNEKFWTDAMRLPQGMKAARITPVDALKLGLLIDIDAVPSVMRAALLEELKTDMSPARAPMLNAPSTTLKLIAANAIPGFVPVGEKVGASCALCHTNTDGSVFVMPGGGSIGHRQDGRSNLRLDFGHILATSENPLAFYPFLQAKLGGMTVGRAPEGLTAHATEAEAKAYLSNARNYPIGMFDDTPDGNGNPVVTTPLFRQDLAAPFGSAGEQPGIEGFSNGVFTIAFDPTSLATSEGRAFLSKVGGKAGTELAVNYAEILRRTGVTGFPFVRAAAGYKVADPASLVGRRVDDQKLADLRVYLDSLPAPAGAHIGPAQAARGRAAFVAACSSCHNPDQSKPVDPTLVDLNRVWPGYRPEIVANRVPPLDPIQNSPGTFDDKMIVVDSSIGGGHRGNALPMLLDLASKPMFLHDGSVPSLDALLDPKRGPNAPHPFYIAEAVKREDVVQFLRSLDTGAASLPPVMPRAASKTE